MGAGYMYNVLVIILKRSKQERERKLVGHTCTCVRVVLIIDNL